MKILLADDCASTLDILRMSLTRWGYEPILVTDGEQALRVLESDGGPRLAILDWSMPRIEGPNVCRMLRGRNENGSSYTYVIVLTSHDGEDCVVEALEAGADDYLTKPVSTRELQLRVRAGERILQLQERLVRTNRKLAVLTTQDPLTKLLNRSTLLERLAQEVERADRSASDLALVTLDVDQFQRVNERFGFQVGDEVLSQLAHRIKNAVRVYDIVGRMGDEEFSIVFPDANHGQAIAMAERIRSTIQDRPFEVLQQSISLTVSLGVASSSTERLDRRKLIHGAAQALRQASHEGGNRLLTWDAGDKVTNPLRRSKIIHPPFARSSKSMQQTGERGSLQG